MDPLDEADSLRTLEVGPDASIEDIHRAYLVLRRIHGLDVAPFIAPAMEEFTAEARREILARIEAAHALLIHLRHQVQAPIPEAGPVPADLPEPDRDVPATGLGLARATARLSLDQVAAQTNVRKEYLRALEEERYEDLPLAAVHVRGYLTAFVNAIGLPEHPMVPAYMQKFLEWQARTPSR